LGYGSEKYFEECENFKSIRVLTGRKMSMREMEAPAVPVLE
jgi:hypothetical protein